VSLLKELSQKLIFVVGKGGVGRSTVSSALASAFAKENEHVLVVQWTLTDSLSPVYGLPPCGHQAVLLPPQFMTMNFSSHEAIREYFVDHLKMKWLHSFLIENKHVQKLLHAAPGISELFFLGRLLWLADLTQNNKGRCYDRVIVDTPAMGHGVSLFGIAQTVARLGITGPLAQECERVTHLLQNPTKTAHVFVTLAEELPVEECMEFIPKASHLLGHAPKMVFINQSANEHFFPDLALLEQPEFFRTHENSSVFAQVFRRNFFESHMKAWAKEKNIATCSLPDVNLAHANVSQERITHILSEVLKKDSFQFGAL